jgi:hypothetical protein
MFRSKAREAVRAGAYLIASKARAEAREKNLSGPHKYMLTILPAGLILYRLESERST